VVQMASRLQVGEETACRQDNAVAVCTEETNLGDDPASVVREDCQPMQAMVWGAALRPPRPLRHRFVVADVSLDGIERGMQSHRRAVLRSQVIQPDFCYRPTKLLGEQGPALDVLNTSISRRSCLAQLALEGEAKPAKGLQSLLHIEHLDEFHDVITRLDQR